MDEDYILRNLLDPREKLPGRLGEITYRQLSLFDDMKIGEVGKMKRRYICTETMTGVLSAIYDAWTYDRSDQEAGIVFWGSVQQEMFCEYREVKEEEKKAQAVRRLIHRHLGEEAELSVGYALLSEDPGKGTAILRMMMEARNLPRREEDYGASLPSGGAPCV